REPVADGAYAGSLHDALPILSLLQETDGEGKVLAGGHSLVPLMKFRITTPATLVDITRIPNLKDVKVEDGRLIVGALKTHHDIRSEEHTSELQSRFDRVCRLL